MNSCISVVFEHFSFIIRTFIIYENSPNTFLSVLLMLCVRNTGNVEKIQDNFYLFLYNWLIPPRSAFK